jgi:hypothetical protein
MVSDPNRDQGASVSEESIPKDALEVLNEIRARDFADISEDLLKKMFLIETASQFESDRGPVVAKLRELIVDESQS